MPAIPSRINVRYSLVPPLDTVARVAAGQWSEAGPDVEPLNALRFVTGPGELTGLNTNAGPATLPDASVATGIGEFPQNAGIWVVGPTLLPALYLSVGPGDTADNLIETAVGPALLPAIYLATGPSELIISQSLATGPGILPGGLEALALLLARHFIRTWGTEAGPHTVRAGARLWGATGPQEAPLAEYMAAGPRGLPGAPVYAAGPEAADGAIPEGAEGVGAGPGEVSAAAVGMAAGPRELPANVAVV